MSADKAPAEKLPLAARKNVRDGWEAKKASLETQMETLLGVKWTLTADPLVIYPYAEANSYGSNSPGDCIYAYFESLVHNLKSFVSTHSTLGVQELNTLCTTHTCTLLPSPKFSYCGCDISNGQLQLLFHPSYLGTNIQDIASNLAAALSSAGPPPSSTTKLSYAARHSIVTEYDAKITPLVEKVRSLLKNEGFEFVPEFEKLGEALKAGKDKREDWEGNLGSFARGYFESFISILEREKFGEDELLREGFEESVTEGKVGLRVVEKLGEGKGSDGYSEVVVEGGWLWIQTTPERWGTNIYYACEKLVDIL